MEHTKKYVLMDPRFVKPSMRDKALSGLDGEISSILNSELNDELKAKQYSAALSRFRNYSADQSPKENPIDKLEPKVLESMPSTVKYKAKRLIDRLKRDKAVDWDKDGQLIYRQRKIPKSDIVELFSNSLKSKSDTKDLPVGWETFAESLHENEIPRELVPNKSIWNEMLRHKPLKETKKKKGKARKGWDEY